MNNIKEFVDNAISYTTYENDMQAVINSKRDEALDMFYGLNLKRMHRLKKNIILNEDQVTKLGQIKKHITLLVITEGWCGDAAQVVPMIQLLAGASDMIDFKIAYRDKNPDLINQYLTNGAQSIPIVLGVNDAGDVLFRWGPRPAFGAAILKDYKDGKLSKDDFLLTLQKKYNKDKGQSILNEIIEKISHA